MTEQPSLSDFQIRRTSADPDQCDHPAMTVDSSPPFNIDLFKPLPRSPTARCPDCGLVNELETGV